MSGKGEKKRKVAEKESSNGSSSAKTTRHLATHDDMNPYATEIVELSSTVQDFSSILNPWFRGDRSVAIGHLYEQYSDLAEKYAWAVPDDNVIHICKQFSPLVEIGAGKGYWASLIGTTDTVITAFDKHTFSSKKNKGNFCEVLKGGPEILSKPEYANRALFLCYPDEGESIAIQCLESFQGQYIIHVGELMFTGGTILGPPSAPFGRTSSAEFQVSLAEGFHCVLVQHLQHRSPFSRDCLTVWKRTEYVVVEDEEDENEEEADEDDEEEEEEEEEEEIPEPPTKRTKKGQDGKPEAASPAEFVDMNDLAQLREAALDAQYAEDGPARYANIPSEEKMTLSQAAPFLHHLLRPKDVSMI